MRRQVSDGVLLKANAEKSSFSYKVFSGSLKLRSESLRCPRERDTGAEAVHSHCLTDTPARYPEVRRRQPAMRAKEGNADALNQGTKTAKRIVPVNTSFFKI